MILVSLDGFRHDYASLYDAQHLLKLGAVGAKADLKPVYPSMTFASHYSIITGLYPERHGIVDNNFYDPARDESYAFNKTANDGSWYRGVPLWVLAEQQGVRAATYAWPGSDAAIGGVRPTYWRDYATAAKGSNDDQVDQALDWLRMPTEKRPRLIVLYFHDADSDGHHSGTDSPELRKAVAESDRVIGRLWDGVQQLPLRVNLIVVSDHGMLDVNGAVALRQFTDLTQVRVVQGGGAIVHIYAPDAEVREKVYRDLKGKDSGFEAYRRAETPERWRYRKDPRIGDLVVVATKPVNLNGRASEAAGDRPMPANKGGHGYDPSLFPQMNGIFFAAGPNIQPGKIPTVFEGIHVYPLIARILGLKRPSDIDGQFSVLKDLYRP